jgi:hypothetical protein
VPKLKFTAEAQRAQRKPIKILGTLPYFPKWDMQSKKKSGDENRIQESTLRVSPHLPTPTLSPKGGGGIIVLYFSLPSASCSLRKYFITPVLQLFYNQKCEHSSIP